MMRKALVLTLLVVAVATATVSKQRVYFSDTTLTKILNGTKNCTTQVYSIGTTPYVALGWNAYAVKAGDSVALSVFYQISDLQTHFPSNRTDTIKVTLYGVPAESTRAMSRRWFYEFYPTVGQYIRFIFDGITGNSDSAYIDSVYLSGDDGN